MDDKQLDELLTRTLTRAPSAEDDAAAARVLTRLAAPLPRQRMSFGQFTNVLFKWDFAPAWPRMAALATCAIVGFAVGLSGLDRLYVVSDAPFITSGRDFGSIFVGDTFTGARP
jgi:hypothetical protein